MYRLSIPETRRGSGQKTRRDAHEVGILAHLGFQLIHLFASTPNDAVDAMSQATASASGSPIRRVPSRSASQRKSYVDLTRGSSDEGEDEEVVQPKSDNKRKRVGLSSNKTIIDGRLMI